MQFATDPVRKSPIRMSDILVSHDLYLRHTIKISINVLRAKVAKKLLINSLKGAMVIRSIFFRVNFQARRMKITDLSCSPFLRNFSLNHVRRVMNRLFRPKNEGTETSERLKKEKIPARISCRYTPGESFFYHRIQANLLRMFNSRD